MIWSTLTGSSPWGGSSTGSPGGPAEREVAGDGAAQFAHVAGPGVLVPAEAERLLQRLLAAAELLAEVAREQEHVALAAAQGRQLDAGDGDAVQELVAETAGGDLAI